VKLSGHEAPPVEHHANIPTKHAAEKLFRAALPK
jgi:hypothetical protein